jgi:predicted transcriptional regulator
MNEQQPVDKLVMTVDIVAAYVANNSISGSEVPTLIASIHAALAGLGNVALAEIPQDKPKPMISARKSLADPKYIISMIDGQPYAMLTRHIKGHGFTAQSYRQTFGLPADYPMTAPAYSERRRVLANAIGLGRKKAVPEPLPVKKRKTTKTP